MSDDLNGSREPGSRTTNQRRKTPWQEAAKRLLKSEMARHDVSYKQLARDLGGSETDQSLMTRINRGTFSVAFFLRALRTMGTKTIDISHLPDGREGGGSKR
jgi:Domain of unknown function (DUF6471)